MSGVGMGSAPSGVLVEAEDFADYGGWVLDSQFESQMGSPYLLAHGLGRPVAAARTTVSIPEAGEYAVLVRTRDWAAPPTSVPAPSTRRTAAPSRLRPGSPRSGRPGSESRNARDNNARDNNAWNNNAWNTSAWDNDAWEHERLGT